MSANDLNFANDLGLKNAICHSFNKMSNAYAKNCSLQNAIAKELLTFCESQQYKKIIDLGAGSGNIAKNLLHSVDFLLGIDNAPNMLNLHPRKCKNIAQIRLLKCDFESYDFSDECDLIISSSALQWAKNLDLMFKKMRDCFELTQDLYVLKGKSKDSPSLADGVRGWVKPSKDLIKSKTFAFAIFTSKSLCELHSFLGTTSPLKSSDEILTIAQKYFAIESKIKTFTRHFSTRDEVLAYLKNSALLGGGNLAFRDKKRLKCTFPHRTLNFEVLFIKGGIK